MKCPFHLLGDFLMLYREDYAGAVSQYEKWHILDPQNPNAMSHIIGACYLMGDFQKAADYVKRHDAVCPPDPYNLVNQGMMYALMGQPDKSFAKIREALRIQPDFNYAYMWLSMTYALREEMDESLKWASEYVSRASSAGLKADAYYHRGRLRSWLGRYREALADFERADKSAVESENWLIKAGALEGQGSVYLARDEFELGRAAFEEELKILVGHLRAWLPYNKVYMAWRLGVLEVEQGRFDLAEPKISAMPAIRAVIEGRDKDRAMVLHDLLQGEAWLAQGELDGALAAGQKACGPRSPFWKHGYRYWGFFNENTSYYMDLTARIFAKKGDIAAAISEYERLFKIPFTYESAYFIHPLHHYRLGVLYEKAGQAVKAKAQYERFLDLWKAADPGLPDVEDAKARLAGLGK